ncbi:E3 ubiquitin-protein ligase HUWE1 isoform X3 [Anoplophora glabripennis]|uniref:E3 ubiquitin-protein ligase HUWE1 isoform X3 n=1 Tax=Anoplophora glabripennis TaxID=217634 RepID=UPI00087437A7|nr:E3 ubiquitin-protein ligase HUWE1 isoform X3 [Anoplophora glabripennis]
MKIDRSRVRKSTSEVPLECQQLIERLQQCSRTELLDELSRIHSWTFGKCELLHWAQVLDVFDRILGTAAERSDDNKWVLKCDTYNEQDFQLLICILRFTSLLIEHSFSRHLYNSMEHLLVLLESNDMSVVLEVLNLLYMFSKRSNFITRLKPDEKECLLSRLQYLAENWGGKENGFGLADCCQADKDIPASATTLHVEFHREDETKSPKRDPRTGEPKIGKPSLHIIHIEHIDKLHKTPAEIMKSLVSLYYVPPEKEMWLFTHVRLATHFADYRNRLKSVQARLQALSVLVYSNAIQDSPSNLLYNGLLEELVEVVELQDPQLTDIRCAALRTLTAIIHLDRNPHVPNRRPGSRLNNIIDVTGASQYHGFLPVLVRNCISSLTNQVDFGHSAFKKMKLQDEISSSSFDESSNESSKTDFCNAQEASHLESAGMDFDIEAVNANNGSGDSKFPVSLTTALFSFLYHLASYESGGEALVSCGMMESLLQVINWQGFELDHITFVTRAVRVIDLITNIDMQAFQVHGGLQSFINRLDVEVNFCKKDQLYQIKMNTSEQTFDENAAGPSTGGENEEEHVTSVDLEFVSENAGKTCLPQRAALLKSMLNFLKKAFQDSTFAESIRHLMEGTLPNSLKNIIANAEYYGPSLFLLATDVVTVYVYQEPALLSALQDNGLTDVVLHSLLVKEVPSTREVLGSLPNVFSALCLNTRGLESFAKCKPFEKLFNILLSPNYLPAMRRRRSSEPTADTACNLGNAMDELMRHQPSLRQDATLAIINLLEELVYLGTNPKYICWRPHSKSEVSPSNNSRSTTNAEGSSDEEEEDEDETSTSSQNAQAESQAQSNSERTPIALIDYILNAMKFIDAILSNNSTDDHCREFVEKGGLKPLLKILGLRNLPVDCPVTNPAQAVATVCKSILNLAHEPVLFREGLSQLGAVLSQLKPLYAKQEGPGGSKLLLELANASDIETAFSTATDTPLLHAMGAAHGYVIMFVHICRTGQTEIRNLSLQHWGSEEGLEVLKGLADLYTSLVWESTLLLAYCSDDLIPSDCDFTREDIEKLNAFFDRCEGNSTSDTTGNVASAMEALSTNPPPISMDVDSETGAAINRQDNRNLKYIKPLLGASSRLGRALAELFGLLVKLCVGSPIRQRRGQNIVAAPPMPSLYARNVATALNILLAEGLDCDRLPPCPTAKCRLTFLICSVGFTSPMLFDERRYPYHLMLKKFVSLGGQAIFFKTFRWALNAGNLSADEGIEYSVLPEGTLGFLDAWLTLLEKMVNPKAILESPHTISSRPSHSYNFDPLKYLIQIHRLAFESVMLFWGKTPLPSYGARMTETLLTILRHIFRGEKIIKEKLRSDENKSDNSGNSNAGPSSTPAIRDTDDNLRQLIDMGFSREHAIEALLHSSTLEQATDYLLSNPPHLIRSAGNSMEVESEDDQVLQAIAISLGCTPTPVDTKKESLEEQGKSFENLINEFTNHALDVCLKLLEVIPETVHKVCELLVTIMKRNGRAYRDNLLDTLIGKIYECVEAISFCSYTYEANIISYYTIAESQIAKRLTNYIHLYILFFEVSSYFEMKIPCGYAIHRAKLLEPLIELMCCSIRMMIGLEVTSEPKWLAPSFLLLDAVSKVAICTDRKFKMHMSTNRVWRWYDLVTGKWAHYSNSNNKLINEAYWNGEQSIRVTCGRKRYTVTFANMLQMNDETGNNRPITMTLMSLTHPSCTDVNVPVPEEPRYADLTEKEEKRCVPVPGLTQNQTREIVRACVRLMQLPIDKDLLHSALQICVRFTRDFEMAKVFVENGGVKCLLKMRQINDFGGFGILATILIRHALEEPNTLKYAMEKVVRGRTLATIPPPYKDLIYLTRQIGGAITRDPEAFDEVASNILRVDINATKGEPAETTLPLKVEPPTRNKAPPLEDSISIEVVCDLLDALLKPLEDETSETEQPKSDSESQGINVDDEESPPSTSARTSNTENGEENTSAENKKSQVSTKKPMLPKSVILKILADAVVSFGPIAKLITEYKYKAECSNIITEDTSALAFIFDKILPATENISDSDCSTMCRMLIAALASSNHSPEAQITLVSEVKVALTRALYLPESSEKHNQVQHICGIISTMIDNCPLPHANRWTSCSINNIVKLMIRRGVFSDLAKITHYLDLSSPNTSFTANAALKPLESLSRTINQPTPSGSQTKNRKSQQSNEETTGAQSGTSTEGTNAQGEDIEDAENTDHDISAVASSLENNAVGTGELDNTLEEMMEILEQRNNDNSQGYNDVPSSRNNTMDIDEDGTIGYDHERDATFDLQEELMSTDSGESDSNPSDQVDDEGNDDNEGDDDNIDDTEENEDNNYDDDDNNDRERRIESSSGMFRIATNDRDEDILMIQYDADNDNALPRMIRWNENGFAVPILDENNPNDHTVAITHPLLMSRNNTETNQSTVSRNQRTNRARRYQYLFSPRNPNPPVILQRLLGPHDPHMANMMSANNLLSGPTEIRESARVVVMDNFGIIPANEEQIDFVDQSGYLFGPSLAATLSHVPPVLHWWNIESKLLDLESVYDCTTYVCNQLIPDLIKYRNEELRNKKLKEDEENSKKRKQKSDPEIQDEFSQETVLFNYDDPNSGPGEQQNKEDDEDIDGVPIPPADVSAEPASREDDEDIDGIPLETSDTSNDRSEGNTQNEDIILSPLQLSFVRGSNENSQSSISEATHNAAVQTTEASENITRNTDDSNSRAESEIRTDSESSNPFEMSLPAYIRSTRPNIIFARPVSSPPLQSSGDRDQEDNEINETQSNQDLIRYTQSTNPLRAIFEEAINQHIDSLTNNDRDSSRTQASAGTSHGEGDSEAPASAEGNGEASNSDAPGEAGPSTINTDEEIPEGVDPSFLEALPPEMRREVLEQHRILCLQQRIAASAASSANNEQQEQANASNEVSPEFLAALPPALQEEVLTQQRLEQQRQAAARANPNEPVDAGAFFETLQPSLRTMILSDMEDSQMSALPPDLAAEAQTLRRDWYARNRQMAQERFLQSNLSTIIRHSRGRQTLRPSNFPRGGWNQWSTPVPSNSQMKIRGRQLLDHEGIACLLILLFTDDPHLNKLRLHRVIRNLCYHAPTREWIINALLSIIEKSVHVQPDDNINKPSRKGPRPGPLTSKLLTDARHLQNGGHWLTIRMEAALGCAANVFIVNKTIGKKCDKSNGSSVISIHPQAAPIVCRNTLDLFTSLAKAFPSCLLPIKCIRDDTEKNTITPVKVKNDTTSSDFWDVLLRLDSATKKGKSIQKNNTSSTTSDADGVISFDQTVFGKLLNLLASPVVNRNTQLTDNLLKLLSVTTSGMPELVKPHKSVKGKPQNSENSANTPPMHALNLAVNVITYKNCSEEGLEFITNLLLNLANSSLEMSFMILNLLLNGAVEIGDIVESQIQSMLKDLKDLISNTQKRKLEEGPSTSKGIIYNRFTNEQVVVTASTKVKTACELQLPSMVPLTSKSSSQVFFLRVLRVIVQIRNPIKQSMKRADSGAYELPALSEQLGSLGSLWETLSQCLLELEHAPDHHAVLVLQPAVEAFFLVHSPQQGAAKGKDKETKETEEESMQDESESEQSNDARATSNSNAPQPEQNPSDGEPQQEPVESNAAEPDRVAETSTKTTVTPEQQQFLAFAEKHRTVLNQILRQSTAHLADGPFAVLVDHTRILDFDIKRRYFRTELERMDHGIRREETAVHVRRSNIFEDSFRELFRRPPEEWKNRFYIVFEDEEGQDAGGLLREWYVIISRDIFNPMYALFTVSPGDRVTYMINSASHYNSNHLCYYKFVGRVIAKAIYDNKLLECYFTRSFYKHILGIPVKYTDMESEDYSFYRGLVYLMENNINHLGLDLTFSTEISEFGVTETRDLIPNGRHIPVTEENKMEYVRLVCQMKMTGAIKQQLNSFLEGFYDIIPMRLISIFNEQELELLISGLPNVDIDDLKANTEYHKYQTNSLQIQWFWRALRSFDQADRAKFLQFVTGTSKVPLQGFGALEGMNGVQKFQIHRDDRSTDRLPSAHTCFNQLDLPVYETYDKLRAYLLKAIHECSEGFGFA